MIKRLYGVYDVLGGFMVALIPDNNQPETFVSEFNRACFQNPPQYVEDAEIYLLGTIDDEDLTIQALPIKQKIGDTKPAYLKLKALREAQEAKAALAKVQEVAKHGN